MPTCDIMQVADAKSKKQTTKQKQVRSAAFVVLAASQQGSSLLPQTAETVDRPPEAGAASCQSRK